MRGEGEGDVREVQRGRGRVDVLVVLQVETEKYSINQAINQSTVRGGKGGESVLNVVKVT